MAQQARIRPARGDDVTAIAACAAQAYGRYVAVIGRQPAPMVADFAALIAEANVYVAVDTQDSVLGYIVFFQSDDNIQLDNIAVRPDLSGRGIGKQMMAFCEHHARGIGATALRLYTNEKMTDNLSIYPHLGFRETHRRREDGFDRVFFEKLL